MGYSKITVSNIWAEDLFKWFHDHIVASSGDGTGMLVCENYKETAEWFREWYEKEYGKKFRKDFYISETEDTINFHDNNENWIFSKTPHSMHSYDYTFIVVGTIVFADDIPDENDNQRTILPGIPLDGGDIIS